MVGEWSPHLSLTGPWGPLVTLPRGWERALWGGAPGCATPSTQTSAASASVPPSPPTPALTADQEARFEEAVNARVEACMKEELEDQGIPSMPIIGVPKDNVNPMPCKCPRKSIEQTTPVTCVTRVTPGAECPHAEGHATLLDLPRDVLVTVGGGICCASREGC